MARIQSGKPDRARLDGNGRQPCQNCHHRSIAGLERGRGLCPYHWSAYIWGSQWARRAYPHHPEAGRLAVPARCNVPAVAVAANGYRACEEHREYDMTRAAGAVGPCDWPMDGLGAAPMARKGER